MLNSPLLQTALALALVASLASFVAPWERIARGWLTVIPAIDIVAVALMRSELVTVVPSAGMLSIFPILWLAYGFAWYAIFGAVAGAAFIAAFTFAAQGIVPTTALEWVNVITLPALIIGVPSLVATAAAFLYSRHHTSKGATASTNVQYTISKAIHVGSDWAIC